MAIPVTCAICGAKDRVGDEAAGTTVTCKACAGPIDVPGIGKVGATAIEEAVPKPTAQRKRDWGDEEQERRSIAKSKPSGGAGPMLIVAAVLAVSCLVCSGVVVVSGLAARQVTMRVAEREAAMQAEQNARIMEQAAKAKVLKDAGKGMMPPKDMVEGGKGVLPPKDLGGNPPGTGKVVFNQQGRLMPNDAIRDGKPHKPFQIRFQQGRTYVIDLQSGEMDSYLRLYDPNGQQVAFDDDSGGFPNARIRYTAAQGGDYVIGATVFGGVPPGGAAFTLTVREE
jgi:hypothetical protein